MLLFDNFALELIEGKFAPENIEDIKRFLSAEQHDAYRKISGFSFAKRDVPANQNMIARFAT